MQRLEVSGAVRLIYKSLGVKGLRYDGGYPEILVCFWGVNTRPQEKVRGQLTIRFFTQRWR